MMLGLVVVVFRFDANGFGYYGGSRGRLLIRVMLMQLILLIMCVRVCML